jgi:hypothetical protein
VICDFSGRQFRLVPGIASGPRWLVPPEGVKVVEHPNHLGGPGKIPNGERVMIRTEPYLIDLMALEPPL